MIITKVRNHARPGLPDPINHPQTKLMNTKTISIEISLSTLEGKEMPEEQRIFDKVIDRLYDFVIDDAAIVDTVHITKVNGELTNDGN